MPKNTYPTEAELRAFLGTLGVPVPEGLDAGAAIAAAAAEWESRTGWYPYLAAQAPATRLFDPPRHGGTLYLEGGLLGLTALAVGVLPDATGAYAPGPGTGGTALVDGLHFYLAPRNAAARGLAFTEVEFLSRVRGRPQSVAVTGVWGRVSAVPDQVWRDVLGYGAFLCVPELGLGVGNGVVKVDDVQFASSTAVSPVQALAAQWERRFLKSAALNKRIVA